MEATLNLLFDFQRFDGNTKMQQVIDSVHSRYAIRELSLSEMDMVAAAGTPELPSKPLEPEKSRQ